MAKITNWSTIGGENIPIVVVNRVPGSGTRANMAKFLFNGDDIQFIPGDTQEESSGVEQLGSETAGAISYVNLAFLGNPNLRPLGIDNVHASLETIQSGQWPIGGPGYAITKGTPTESTAAFLEYLQSPAFQQSAAYSRLGFVAPRK